MVRPNHDLPNLLVGGIRDYADQEGLDDSEAHAELLRDALRNAGILCGSAHTGESEGKDEGDGPDENG